MATPVQKLQEAEPVPPEPWGQVGRDGLSLSPQEKGHNGGCGDPLLLPLSLGYGNSPVKISRCFCGAEGDESVMLELLGLLISTTLRGAFCNGPLEVNCS